MFRLLAEKPLIGLVPSSIPPIIAEVTGRLSQWQIELAWIIGIAGGVLAIVVHVRNLRKK